jgi:hypothetical protein
VATSGVIVTSSNSRTTAPGLSVGNASKRARRAPLHADPAEASERKMKVLMRVLKERHALIHEFARLLD